MLFFFFYIFIKRVFMQFIQNNTKQNFPIHEIERSEEAPLKKTKAIHFFSLPLINPPSGNGLKRSKTTSDLSALNPISNQENTPPATKPLMTRSPHYPPLSPKVSLIGLRCLSPGIAFEAT